MHWLQSLDTSLFYFVNRSLSNPLFDWLMPILSGGHGAMKWFIPLALIAALATIVFGSTRARLCALMVFLVVILGDPLIVNVIKHAVNRPRPCAALSDVIERLGCTESGSMPSAHAANWFAATMVVFLFYRRSLWIMLPMALGVSFSRVYNGVHYPGDVLAGALLGAGYAVAFAVAVQTIWDFGGKRFFPTWQARCPDILGRQTTPSPVTRHPSPEAEWLHSGYLFIFVMLIARWIYLASGTIELEKDEAYQWLWSKHLALSYYSKPPGIALIQFVGTHLFGDTAFGVRFLSPLFAAILSLMAFRFVSREINVRVAFWLLLIVTAAPLLGVGTILMTIDPPLVLCWTWAVIAGWRAVQSDGNIRDWLLVGLAMGLGFLCKYTAAVQIVCWLFVFLLLPSARLHLRKAGPWLALLIFLICTTPVLIWNAQHGWSTFNDVGSDAGLKSHWHPTLRFFWDFIFTQAGLLNPIFFVGAIWAMFAFWKSRRERPIGLYFFCMSAPLYFGYWLFSLHSRVLPNWPVAAVPPMFCLMAVYWDEKFRHGARFVKYFLIAGLALGFIMAIFMFNTNLIGKVTGQLLPAEKDPLRRVRGWKQTAACAETARETLANQGTPAFIIADHYSTTALVTFYLPEARATLTTEPLVYCIDSDQPVNQLYFWPEYNYSTHRKGENAILISEVGTYPLENNWFWKWLMHKKVGYGDVPPPAPAPKQIFGQFETITDLGEKEIKVGNRILRRVHLWACYNLK